MRASVGMDASEAIGIVQRQGISKLRHVEVDVLWVQEQQARTFLPLRKVPVPRNPSDMGTKHIALALMDQYLQQLNLEVAEGRAAIAQHLHAVAPGDSQAEDGRACDLEIPLHRPAMHPRRNKIPKSAAAGRHMDSWSASGAGGSWVRTHRTPRRALYTPYKVAGGPDRDVRMKRYRVTTGTYTLSGEGFKITDDSLKPGNAHRLLKGSWTGATEFQ